MRVGFLVFDGYSNMVLASAIEPLRAARDYVGEDMFSWRLLTPDGRSLVTGGSNHVAEVRSHVVRTEDNHG